LNYARKELINISSSEQAANYQLCRRLPFPLENQKLSRGLGGTAFRLCRKDINYSFAKPVNPKAFAFGGLILQFQ